MRKSYFLPLIIISILILQGIGSCQRNQPSTNFGKKRYALGEIIVKFKPEAFNGTGKLIAESVIKLNKKHGLVSMNRLLKERSTGALSNIYVLRFSNKIDIMRFINEYSDNPFVVYAEPNYIMHAVEKK